MCTMDFPKFIVANQEEESISIQRVKLPYVRLFGAHSVMIQGFVRVSNVYLNWPVINVCILSCKSTAL